MADTQTALAARQLNRAGIKSHPGERVEYTITDAKAKDKSDCVRAADVDGNSGYDVEEYVRLLEQAASEIISLSYPFKIESFQTQF
ncbi:MAG TPA: hypothetical protein VNN73_12115 [Blastocatellia bacterium]|nr:hypothetical protein [Blastocatellia bacterium]